MFSDKLKQLREEKEYSQEYVAGYLGVKQQTYSKYENKLIEPDIASIVKLAKLYNVSTDYLFGVSQFRLAELDKLPANIKEKVNSYIQFLLTEPKEN